MKALETEPVTDKATTADPLSAREYRHLWVAEREHRRSLEGALARTAMSEAARAERYARALRDLAERLGGLVVTDGDTTCTVSYYVQQVLAAGGREGS